MIRAKSACGTETARNGAIRRHLSLWAVELMRAIAGLLTQGVDKVWPRLPQAPDLC